MATYSQAKPAGTPTWIDVMSPDADAARAFYQAVFGWEYDVGGPQFGGYTTARVGQYMVAGLVGNQPGAPPMPAAWNVYFASDDIGADVQRAAQLGATVMSPPMAIADFGSMAACADPGGAMFSFWQAGSHVGAQLTEEPGSVAWFELYAHDAQQARDFYSALLGAEVEAMPGDMEYYVLTLGGRQICGIMQIDPSWGNFAPQWAVYFAVANTDETVRRITAHGGRLLGNVDDTPFGRMAAVMDPAGATFKVIQPPAR